MPVGGGRCRLVGWGSSEKKKKDLQRPKLSISDLAVAGGSVE